MKKLIFLIVILVVFAISGCKNDCGKIDCIHGFCQDGECLCETGWQKDENGICQKPLLCSSGTDCVHGDCQDGECLCDAGWQKDENGHCTKLIECAASYEQDSLGQCTVKGIQKFLGKWQGSEECHHNGQTDYQTYDIIFRVHPTDSTKIIIENVSNLTCSGQTLVVEGTLQRDANGKYTIIGDFSPQCTAIPYFNISEISWYNKTVSIRFTRTFVSPNDAGTCYITLTKI